MGADTRRVQNGIKTHTVTESSWQRALPPIFSTIITGAVVMVLVTSQVMNAWLWRPCGDFLQSKWLDIYNWFEGNELNLVMIGTFVVTNSVFWGENMLIGCLDLTSKPKWLLKYKVQEDKNVPLAFDDWMRAVKVAMLNLDIVSLPIFLIIMQLMIWRGCSFGPELPSLVWVLIDLIVCVLVEEIGFYYSHRLFHHPYFYKHIHKMHHEWIAPISLVSVYAHPIEHLVAFILPPLVGPLIMGSHITTAWLWYGLALTSTNLAHSGYHFPFCPSPEKHDYHHLKFNVNYGAIGILDWLHGTDEQFLTSRQYQEHFVIFGFRTAKDIVDEQLAKKKAMENGKID